MELFFIRGGLSSKSSLVSGRITRLYSAVCVWTSYPDVLDGINVRTAEL